MTAARPGSAPAGVAGSLSSKEQALWLFQDLADDSGVLNVPLALRSRKRLRWWPLQTAAQHLVYRHPALRTVFPEVDGLPTRQTLDSDDERATVEVEVHQATAESLPEQLIAFAARPFEIRTELPIRIGHFVGCPDGDVLCLVAHHIAFDAVSGGVTLRELLELYDSLAARNEIPGRLANVVPAFYEPAPRAEDVQYWREDLAGVEQASGQLAMASSAQPDRSFAGAAVQVEFPAAALGELSRELGATPNIVLFALYALLLAARGVDSDIVIGVLVDTRGDAYRYAVGYHVSLLPMRLRITPEQSFRQLVRSARETFLTGVLHASASVDDVFPGSYERAGAWRVPMFRHLFNFRVSPFGDLADRFPWVELMEVDTGFSRLDLELHVGYSGNAVRAHARYRSDLLDGADVESLLERLGILLGEVANDPDRAIGAMAGLAGDVVERPPRDALGEGQEPSASAAAEPSPEPDPEVDELVPELVGLCRDALSNPALDANTHFFRNGANSLDAARLVARIKALLGVRLSLRGVFNAPTPVELARHIAAIRAGRR